MRRTEEKHLFGRREIWRLLIPLMVEQVLTSLMGTADTIMVSNVGSAAISAVSLVDAVNVLVIQAFAALAAGGTIICSQYLGQGSADRAQRAAQQLILSVTLLAVCTAAVCLCLRTPLLHLIFGSVEEEVMRNSEIYFFYTALSFPFLALYNAGSAVFRAQENTGTPMRISVISNFLNIAGNAFLIWGVGMGVAGAALATLLSRIFSALAVMYLLRGALVIPIRNYAALRPDWPVIRRVLAIGVPSGIENSMFQFGKLAIQSTVSTLGTVAIAAQAMTNVLETLNGICGVGVGIGMMTVVGECIGAGREDEAVYYIKKLSAIGELVVTLGCLLVYALAGPVTKIGGMEEESARLCLSMMRLITIVKPLLWTVSFIPAYGMRAAGDVKFSMVLTCLSMWLFRVSLCMFLCRHMGFGPVGVWIGMFTDWGVRAILFTLRFHSRKWLGHKVIE